MNIDRTPRKIALFGVFGVGNLGNECTLEAMISNLRKNLPNAEISCICSDSAEVRSVYGIPAFPIREVFFNWQPKENSRAVRFLRKIFVGVPSEFFRWYKTTKVLMGYDMLVMTGTGMLGDFGIRPFDLHYDILRWSILARLARCKLLFISVGVGPIRNRLSRWFVRTALTFANYRSYRDTFSKKYLESIGFKANGDFVYPDLAFSLPQLPKNDPLPGHDKQTVVGVGVMTYYDKVHSQEHDESAYRDYLEKLAAFVRWLMRNNYAVRLIIGDAKYDGRVRLDLKTLVEANGVVNGSGSFVDEPASSFDEVLLQLAATDLVVASRFHNVLLALLLGKPVMAISYHEKVEALISGVGLQEFSQDIEHINVDKMVEQFRKLEESGATLKPRLEGRIKDYRKALDQQYHHITHCV